MLAAYEAVRRAEHSAFSADGQVFACCPYRHAIGLPSALTGVYHLSRHHVIELFGDMASLPSPAIVGGEITCNAPTTGCSARGK
jgi:hypothetical protein